MPASDKASTYPFVSIMFSSNSVSMYTTRRQCQFFDEPCTFFMLTSLPASLQVAPVSESEDEKTELHGYEAISQESFATLHIYLMAYI